MPLLQEVFLHGRLFGIPCQVEEMHRDSSRAPRENLIDVPRVYYGTTAARDLFRQKSHCKTREIRPMCCRSGKSGGFSPSRHDKKLPSTERMALFSFPLIVI